MSLTIEERERPHDGFRNAGVIGHFNGTIESLDETGAKVTGVTKPDLSKPIGDQVAFSVEGKQPNGDTVFCHGVSVFARRTVCLQQAINSRTAPGVTDLVLNPDAHLGYGAPVGCVMASPTHIYPGPVGVDIKCSTST